MDEIKIPRNINPSAFTTIVWDNNDFSEETLSGKGTTHVANGIILQNMTCVNGRVGDKVLVSKKTRTIKAPENKIFPYRLQKKGTIGLRVEASGILLDERSYSHEQHTGRMADFYISYPEKMHLKTWTRGEKSN